jgi:drug/metabolite transporter (DMT)-like permease
MKKARHVRNARVTEPSSSSIAGHLYWLGPVLLGATAFACADILCKVALNAGADVLTTSAFRGFIGLAMLAVWLRLGSPPTAATPRAKAMAYLVGLIFACNVYFVFKAIGELEVPVAILIYFVYPLLTGLVAAVTGIERLGWMGLAAAVTAFVGLALMLGANPQKLAIVGVLSAFAGACFRAALLLVTRATLAGTDARLITWYSMVSSTAVLLLAVIVTWNWQPPTTTLGWFAFVALGVAITLGIFGLSLSATRIGAFRTALFMNLEPPLTAVASAIFLGEVLAPLQWLGGAIMIGALVAFQLRR